MKVFVAQTSREIERFVNTNNIEKNNIVNIVFANGQFTLFYFE